MQTEIDKALADLQRAQHRETVAETNLNQWVSNQQSTAQASRSSGRTNRRDYAAMHSSRVSASATPAPVNEQLAETLWKAKEDTASKANAHKAAVEKMEDF